MAEPRHWFLFLYDVLEPDRLRRVHKILKAWGYPVQYSVFRVRGTSREVERLRFELAKQMETKDRLLVVRLCAGCASRVTMRGEQLSPLEPEPPPFKIL